MTLRTRTKKLLILPALLAVGCGVAGCQADVLQAMPAVTKMQTLFSDPVDLTKVNYTAADQLAYQANANISRDTEITVTKLYDLNDVNSDVQFAYIVPQNVGTRLAQLGYNVRFDDGEVASAADVTPSRKAGWRVQKADLGGSYRVDGSEILINLRMTEQPSSKLLGAYEYKVRRTSKIGRLLIPPEAKVTASPAAPAEPVDLQQNPPGRVMPEAVLKQAITDPTNK